MSSSIALSPLLKSMRVAASGIHAQNQRMLIISQNLAHAGMRTSPQDTPYQRQVIELISRLDKKSGSHLIHIKGIRKDPRPFERIYAPDDPMSDKTGYVLESNVKAPTEMVDLRETGRSHESVVRAFEKSLAMFQNTIGLLKN